METELSRWGNSLAVRIPKKTLKQANLQEGDSLALSVVKNGEIKLRVKRKRPTLRQMIDRITPENTHARVDWGNPQGQELL